MGLFSSFLIIGVQLLSSFHFANALPNFNTRSNVVAGLVGGAVDMTSGGGGTYPRANLLANGNLIGAYTSVGISVFL